MKIDVKDAKALVLRTLAEVRRNTLLFFDKDKDSRDIRLCRYNDSDDPALVCKVKFKNTRVVEVAVDVKGVHLAFKQKGKEYNLVERYKTLRTDTIALDTESITGALAQSFIWGSSHPEITWKKAMGVPLYSLDVIHSLGKDKVAYARINEATKLQNAGNGKAIYSLDLMVNGKFLNVRLPLKVADKTVLPGRYLLIDHAGETITCSLSTLPHYLALDR